MQQHNMSSHGRQMHQQSMPRYAPHAAIPGQGGAPPGTFSPGTKIQVGGHRVVIQKYLSEGGFAHVYVVKMPKPVDGTDIAVLKRVAVPDKEALRGMRTEVETMKRLKGHRPIVRYIDSHASELTNGGYEVFLLMEYCDGGGLIDFMNTRLQHRLTEPEIVQIFADISEGVACMHYLKPALLHRDLKVENVLITSQGKSKRFKLCDFGSAAPPRPAPTTVAECRAMDEDVQKHTTLQYRSPEMVDVYRKQPLNEKSDIWALGVLLYKLCYYTTPFEDQGQLAILNASFRFPSQPIFSDRLKKLIASMLKESIQSRPNIYQVLKEACAMQGREVPIPDIYSGAAKAQHAKSTPGPASTISKPIVGAVITTPVAEKKHIPEITPMRRGRPQASPARIQTPQPSTSQPVSSGDPFAALDAQAKSKPNDDELSSRFPDLDQFSLLHNKGDKFNFDSPTSPPPKPAKDGMAEKLADAAFAVRQPAQVSASVPQLKPKPTASAPAPAPAPAPVPVVATRPTSSRPTASPSPASTIRPQSLITPQSSSPAIPVHAPNSKYVSTGTMTSDLPVNKASRPTSLLTATSNALLNPSSLTATIPPTRNIISPKPQPLNEGRPSSAQAKPDGLSHSTGDANVAERTHVAQPVSHLNDQKSDKYLANKQTAAVPVQNSPSDYVKLPIQRFGAVPRVDRPISTSGEVKRQFGDQTVDRLNQHHVATAPAQSRPQSSIKNAVEQSLVSLETTLASNDATYEDSSDEEDDLSPEMRREMERLQLEEEEQRVAAAQAEYRNRIGSAQSVSKPALGVKSATAPTRASTIQNRVQALLSEDQRQPVPQRTAEGYGKYSDAATAASKVQKTPPEIKRKPILASGHGANAMRPSSGKMSPIKSVEANTGTSGSAANLSKQLTKPPAPKKPGYLNSLSTGTERQASPIKPGPAAKEQLIAIDVPGQPILEMTSHEKDEYMEDFSKRFPSLSAIEGSSR